MNRNRSYSLPASQMSQSDNPLLSLWASISRPPVHAPMLEFTPFDSPSNNLWDFHESSYPTPLEPNHDQLLPSNPVSSLFKEEPSGSSLLFDSLLVANTNGSQINKQRDEFIGRYRSFSQSCAIPKVCAGNDKSIKCPYCDKDVLQKI
jgi:hypothetical protein